MFLAGLFVYTMFATCLFQTALGGDKKGESEGLLGKLLTHAMNKHEERKAKKQKEEEEAEQKAKDEKAAAEQKAKDEKEARRLIRLKAFSQLKKEVDAHADDDSDEAKQLREQYEATLTCMYDENGEERSEEEIQEQYKKLPKSMRDSVDKYSKMDPNSEEMKKQIDKFNEAPFTEKDVEIAQEEIKSDIATIQKKKALLKIEEEKQDALAKAKTDEERSAIEKEYEEKKTKTAGFYDVKIGDSKKKIEAIQARPTEKEIENKQKEIDDLNKQKEDQQKLVDGDEEAIKAETDKYKDLKWPAELENGAGDLESDVPEVKEKAQKFLTDQGLDEETYRAYTNLPKDENGEVKTDDPKFSEFKDGIREKAQKRIEDIDKSIEQKTKEMNGEDLKPKEDEPKPKKEGEPKPKKEGEPEPKEDETNDDETDDETKSSTFDDGEPEDDEVDDKGESKKDPKVVWKRKTYKRGDKSFKTKSYYNKKGDSITADEFKEKVKNYSKANESLTDYLRSSIEYKFISENNSLSNYLK